MNARPIRVAVLGLVVIAGSAAACGPPTPVQRYHPMLGGEPDAGNAGSGGSGEDQTGGTGGATGPSGRAPAGVCHKLRESPCRPRRGRTVSSAAS